MRVLMVQPPALFGVDARILQQHADSDTRQIPIGVYILDAMLRARGHDVRILNHAVTPSSQGLPQVLHQRPDLLAITCQTHNRHGALSLAAAVKKSRPATRVVLGGVHPSFVYEELFERSDAVDFVAVGEAENSFPELVDRLERGHDVRDLPGIAVRLDDGAAHWCGHAEPVQDLGALPIPAESHDYEVLATARGCPFACTFCASPVLWGRRVRERPVEHFVRELEILRSRHGRRYVAIKDDTFTAKASRVEEVCRAMIGADLGMRWLCDTRVDCVDEERLAWMRRAGCTHVSFGVESGSPRLLESIRKRIRPPQVIEATRLARRLGLEVRYYLIAGFPDETEQDLQASADLVAEGRPHYVVLSDLSLLPGTEVFREHAAKHGLDDSFWFENQDVFVLRDPERSWLKSQAGARLMALHNVGLTFHERPPHYPTTEEELRGAVERLPGTFLPLFDLAEHLRTHKRYEEATDYYLKALGVRRDASNALLSLGLNYLGADRDQSARDAWQRVLDLEDAATADRVQALSYLGALEAESGDVEKGWRLFEEARALDPRSTLPLRRMCETALALQNWDLAAEAAETWANLSPDASEAWGAAGLAAMGQGLVEDAVDLFEQSLGIDAANARSLHHYALLLAGLGRTKEARELVRRLLQVSPGHEGGRALLRNLGAS